MNILLVGGGSKFGKNLYDYFEKNNHTVWVITGSDTTDSKSLVIDWKTVKVNDLHKWITSLPTLDLIFFNQNGSSLCEESFSKEFSTMSLWKQIKDWTQTYYVSCQLPFQIIHSLGNKISNNTKVIWMLSSMIKYNRDSSYADYIGNKYQNMLIMQQFSKSRNGCYIGLDPKSLNKNPELSNYFSGLDILLNMKNVELNGKVFNFDASEVSWTDSFE